MFDIVTANLDKTVRVTYRNGETDLALVLTVDDEGFVCDLASVRPEDRKTAFWSAFSEIAEIESAESCENSR
jgi:hypothetical protein